MLQGAAVQHRECPSSTRLLQRFEFLFFRLLRPRRSNSIVIDHRRWLRIRNESLGGPGGKDKKTNPVPRTAPPAASSLFSSLFHRCSGLLLPAAQWFTNRLTDGTNNGVKFIRLHIGAIKRQTDRQSSKREARTKEGLILNIIYLPG